MKSFRLFVPVCIGLMFASGAAAHHGPRHPGDVAQAGVVAQSEGVAAPAPPGVTGQGDLRFKLLYGRDHLPEEAVAVLQAAHGGFAIDRRPGKGEVYFALPGAGIIQISADLKSARMIPTAPEVKDANMHNTTIWYDAAGNAFLTFPGNDVAKVFTTTLDGKLVSTLDSPSPEFDFDNPTVNAYFDNNGKFAPTDADRLDDLLYITTGYSALDYVLTARVNAGNGVSMQWHDLAFGGKGAVAGQFGTGHGITIPPGLKRVDVADRPNSEIERFTRYGHYRSTVSLPQGSFPCDVDYEGELACVGCLHGPDRTKGAPIYILRNDELVSTLMPKEDLGLEKFTHVHNAVIRRVGETLYVIAQAWNPGDFAILAQVKD